MTHDHGALGNRPCTEISGDACLVPREHGYWFCHDVPGNDERCIGGVNVAPGGPPTWSEAGSLEAGDLTLTPSVRCVTHEFHGWVREGRWAPA